ncbi:helix-turn-helix domain-containing protein [Tissierella sp.]|uniref:helix-turn-helix domain-containing protein n=1 Tax=Tissierella sp. TaxID=41274 RepID=UPI002862D69B|nr:helix-turn-helix domain-containing protein [Tissierella sp.]MDR7856633.1 helix-turn-helix domain-containing protein [Tissierella sp.]
MEFEKLYTVEDIAKMTGLTSRTIRNYLKDGKLKGKKIGVQWRFTEENISELFNDKDFSNSVDEAKNQIVIDFIKNKEAKDINICSIIDYPCESYDKIEDLSKKLLEVVNLRKKTGHITYSFQFQEEYKKARFIITGEVEGVQEILDILATAKL